jgi:4-hydroxysphinganine ceramide fatty acyl 2-hydroxylase
MLLAFFRHGSVAALLVAVLAEVLAWLLGFLTLQAGMILLGALLFYLSEYGMHRFAFQTAKVAGASLYASDATDRSKNKSPVPRTL